MDRFYKINIAVLLVLSVITVGMLVQHEIEVQGSVNPKFTKKAILKRKYEKQMARNAWLYGKVISLQKAGQSVQAIEELRKIMANNPSDAYASVLLGRLYYQQGRLADAIHSYRKAVQKDPDYVDKKTPLYIGDEIMELISNARGKLNREKRLKPNDTKIQTAINDIYYLQRRIAGGCE